MNVLTVLLLILAAIVALGVVVFQYYYKSKKRGRLLIILSFLRFLTLFGLFLLIINPKFSKKKYTLKKPNLLLLVDNSTSIAPFDTSINSIIKTVTTNKEVKDRFDIDLYSFGNTLSDSDTIVFDKKNTNISNALKTVGEIYNNVSSAIVLITDGNQTLGTDYAFYGKNQEFPIYPVVVGDTTHYEDLRIDQVNANRYAFLKNKFPVEVFLSYEGKRNIQSKVTISLEGKIVFNKVVDFSRLKNTKIVNTFLEASSVGTKFVRVEVDPLKNEKNIRNNVKNLVIEVIDEKTNVAIIANVIHPDLGALIKAIESNEQRKVSILKPTVSKKELEKVDLFVLYQPDQTFRGIYDYLEKNQSGIITIMGTHTDWRFLNTVQDKFNVGVNYPVQEIFPVKNTAFTKFDVSEFSYEEYPPLESDVGPITISVENDILLNTRIKGKEMESPLISVLDDGSSKEVLIFGENLWEWRVQSFREQQNFGNFDNLMGKLLIYLSDTKSKKRLNIDYKSIYEGNRDAKISATYFDEAFVFDSNAQLSIRIKGKDNNVSRDIPMLLKGMQYEADVSDLPSGSYDFTVIEKDEKRSASRSFTIMDFDVEQQFLSSDYRKLALLASDTGGSLYYPPSIEDLIDDIINDNRYRPIESSTENVVSLIDFRIVLAIIVMALVFEWFIRKYNGLI